MRNSLRSRNRTDQTRSVAGIAPLWIFQWSALVALNFPITALARLARIGRTPCAQCLLEASTGASGRALSTRRRADRYPFGVRRRAVVCVLDYALSLHLDLSLPMLADGGMCCQYMVGSDCTAPRASSRSNAYARLYYLRGCAERQGRSCTALLRCCWPAGGSASLCRSYGGRSDRILYGNGSWA